ncbi:hypothetical protein DRN63_00120 [Nanoarchaeota archaeon]|nr:MAG: hypothetical protein DRN63_00120 [Nanoarchaeota archaeon]
MRILVTSDIHSRFHNLEKILRDVEFDLLLISGDITNFRAIDIERADEIISKYAPECYAVHGNCDPEIVLKMKLDSIKFIHGMTAKLDEFTLHGVGGSGPTPFKTPSEYPDSYFEKMLSKLEPHSNLNILISHCPPYGILDLTKSGEHIGCRAVRKHASRFDVILCGHVHEAHGVERGEVFAINPGPIAWGRYAIFDTETFDVRLMKIP